MAGGDTELCGFLDAKLPGNKGVSHRVRKRSLAPWKVWKRHWCSVKKLGPGLGLEVQLDCGISSGGATVPNERDNSIKIPFDALICRTESRSKQFAFGIFPAKERKPLLYLSGNSETETQRWMANLRQFLKPRRHRFMDGTYHISIVDNTHSRAAGLIGMHGDMVTSRLGLFIKDVHSGEIIENLEWKELNQFHLSTAGRPEDVKRICVIHTTKAFRGGVGELYIFCLEAAKLLQDLVTQGRGPRQKHLNQRPLSLSEGDLRLSIYNDSDSENFPVLKSKVASNLINAGLGLLMSSRSGSEIKLLNEIRQNTMLEKITSTKLSIHTQRAVDNVYQPEPASIPNISSSLEELEEPSPRRVSNISVASGIYEEIPENVNSFKAVRLPSNFYEDPEDLFFGSCCTRQQPPPLPPRQICGSGSTRNGSISDDGLDSEGGTRSATPNTQDEATPTPEEKTNTMNPASINNSDYVPMSPRLKDIAQRNYKKPSQEEFYMVMR